MPDVVNVITPSVPGGELAAISSLATAPGPMVLNGDTLILSLTTSDSSGVVGIRGRLLRVDGEVVPFAHTMTFSGTGTQTEVVCPLTAGWIIGFDVSRDSGTLTDGEVVASVHVGRNVGSLQQKLICLASGDISDIRSLGMNAFTSAGSTATAETFTITTTAIADPAAGVELSVAVTAAQVWELQALRAIFTTSATVATREVSLQLDDGTNTFYKAVASGTQTASLARGYNFTDCGSSYQSTGGGNYMVGIGRPLLAATYRISTSVSNIQAGDLWTGCYFNYRRRS